MSDIARYIDADALLSRLPDALPYKARVKRVLMQAPEADVVPKSEVEALENTYRRAIRKIDNKTITAIRNAKQEVAREIFEEIANIIRKYDERPNYNMMLELSLLEKKYTEEK